MYDLERFYGTKVSFYKGTDSYKSYKLVQTCYFSMLLMPYPWPFLELKIPSKIFFRGHIFEPHLMRLSLAEACGTMATCLIIFAIICLSFGAWFGSKRQKKATLAEYSSEMTRECVKKNCACKLDLAKLARKDLPWAQLMGSQDITLRPSSITTQEENGSTANSLVLMNLGDKFGKKIVESKQRATASNEPLGNPLVSWHWTSP